jgi:multidrug efflux pump subunit AcrB
LTGLDNIEGHAREGVCFWVLRFEVGQFNGKSIDQVNAQIAQAQLPNIKYRVERPRMRHPVLSFILHGPETLAELEAVAYSAKRELQGLGIDHVRTQGIQAPDSMLKLSSQDLHNTGLSITEVKQLVQQQLPRQVGTHKTSQAPSTSVASLEWSQQSLESQLQKILIGGVTADTLLQVVHEYPQQSPRVFWHNKPAVSMTISRDIGGSDIFTLQKVFASWQKSFEQRWGTLVSLQTYEETWRLLAFRIELLVNNGITGLILIVCVLGIIFHIVVAKWIAAGIPICIAASCIMLQILGGSINFLSTFAFVMALGIIVDDTIVIAEQAYREYENGKTPRQAVLDACQMMFLPIMAASLTTVASFMPLLAIPGEYGKIMIDIPRVIICVLLASIIECFFILPRHMRDALERLPKQMPGWQYYIQNGIAKIQFQYGAQSILFLY